MEVLRDKLSNDQAYPLSLGLVAAGLGLVFTVH